MEVPSEERGYDTGRKSRLKMKHGMEESEMMLAAAVVCEQVERTQKGPWANHPCSRI